MLRDGETGMEKGRRSLEPVRAFLVWTTKHDPQFTNKCSIASIGVVMGQLRNLFYRPPRDISMPDEMNGLYSALLEDRLLFHFVREEKRR